MPSKDPVESMEKLEPALAKAGVQSRWIQVVSDGGSPIVKNPFLPCMLSDKAAAENEKLLSRWVDEIHRSGMSAMSWFSLSYCESGNIQNPDWRQVSILQWPNTGSERGPCCINSPYGDALIQYCNWAIERFNLDGIWFDGSFWTPIWERPLPLTCRCMACQMKFKQKTCLEIPERLDWHDPVFRRWLAWRYEAFADYLNRLSASIRQAHPNAAVVINHYHRCIAPWHGGLPLDKFDADIITGSEAYTAESIDLTMRLCRAYGRSQSEVWRELDVGPNIPSGIEHLLEHALVCYATGGQPSYGYEPFTERDENVVTAIARMTPIMEAIHPYVGGNSLPYCAVHVSQQTETFWFGPVQGRPWEDKPFYQEDPYFQALSHWTQGLIRAQIPADFIFDADFTPQALARYPVLLMPLSMALDDDQVKTAIEYVRSGGTLLLGPGAGQCDGMGLPRDKNPLADALGFSFDRIVQPIDETLDVATTIDAEGRQTAICADRRAVLRLDAVEWNILYREGKDAASLPAVAARPFGQGHVIVLSFDGVAYLGAAPFSGGDSGMQVVAEPSASGKYCLECTDGPAAPQSFYPSLEIPVAPFESPDFHGGSLDFDVKVDGRAAITVDLRATAGSLDGPRWILEPGGRISLGGQFVGEIPLDQWVHVSVCFDFAQEGRVSACRTSVVLPDGKKIKSPSLPIADDTFRRIGRIVFYGPDHERSTYFLDGLKLTARRRGGRLLDVFSEDFEAGSDALTSPWQRISRLSCILSNITPPPITIEASPDVRAGIVKDDSCRIFVHLHNRNGKLVDWQQPIGPKVVLRGRLPIRKAYLAVDGKPLDIHRQNDLWDVYLPAIGLYQVVVLEQ